MSADHPKNEKLQAHELIERLPATQLAAVVNLLEAMLDPVARAVANAPIDDEPETDAQREAVAKSKSWLERQPAGGIAHEEVLADFGITPDEIKKQKV
jgi:hypothetical protein